LTSHTQDDAFHEIQLNGKQLVFLFMAATVVSVVIFLCGVLVGRGVRAERGGTFADAGLTAEAAAAETTPQRPAPAPAATAAGSDPTAAAPPPTVDDLSYFKRLEKPNQPAENLKAAPALEKPIPAAAEKSHAADTRATKPAATSTTKDSTGFAVQVAALNVRGEADAIAKRLTSKGYAAYVLTPADGTPAVYRVRVGKFGSRREAETVAAKLQKEEQFKPWITR
jgi:cell division septation protein DedD